MKIKFCILKILFITIMALHGSESSINLTSDCIVNLNPVESSLAASSDKQSSNEAVKDFARKLKAKKDYETRITKRPIAELSDEEIATELQSVVAHMTSEVWWRDYTESPGFKAMVEKDRLDRQKAQEWRVAVEERLQARIKQSERRKTLRNYQGLVVDNQNLQACGDKKRLLQTVDNEL